jgi:hypothetical protein
MKIKNQKKSNFKNLSLIKKALLKKQLAILAIFILISLFYKYYVYIYSSLLGSFFSFMVLDNLIKSQKIIMDQQKVASFFPRYVSRLFLYAAPVIAAIKLDYFNLGVTVVFLVSMPLLLLLSMFLRLFKKVKPFIPKPK